jgi:transcriptional regulator NrdR family protein
VSDKTRAQDAFPCACGDLFSVVSDTRGNLVAVRRRRRCPTCDARLTTYEITRERYEQLLHAERDFRTIQPILRRASVRVERMAATP